MYELRERIMLGEEQLALAPTLHRTFRRILEAIAICSFSQPRDQSRNESLKGKLGHIINRSLVDIAAQVLERRDSRRADAIGSMRNDMY